MAGWLNEWMHGKKFVSESLTETANSFNTTTNIRLHLEDVTVRTSERVAGTRLECLGHR